jgi:hypothetical protein
MCDVLPLFWYFVFCLLVFSFSFWRGPGGAEPKFWARAKIKHDFLMKGISYLQLSSFQQHDESAIAS